MYLQPVSTRERFTRDDLAFVVEVLADKASEADALLGLLADTEEAAPLFDDPRLCDALHRRDTLSEVSPRFFLYVSLRRILREAGIESRRLADYLTEMLTQFIDHGHLRTVPGSGGAPADYEFELQTVLASADGARTFELHCYGGDRSLYMTGFHRGFLERRSERRGAPGVRYYESTGRQHYRTARDHPLAEEFACRDTLDMLFHTFPLIRQRLNRLADEYFN